MTKPEFLINTNPLVQKAFEIARKAHHGQKRRGGADYITHCVDVADRFTDPTDVAIALLHDVLEDTDWSASDLENEGIPDEVIKGVEQLTRYPGISYEDFILRISKAPPNIIHIKLADIFCNLNDQPTSNQIRKYAKALLVLVPEPAMKTLIESFEPADHQCESDTSKYPKGECWICAESNPDASDHQRKTPDTK